MRNVLVTGAAGFIGFRLAQILSEKPDTQVHIVDNFVRGEKDEAYAELSKKRTVTAYELDLTEASALSALPEACDAIFHLAALNGTQNFYERPYDVVRCSTLPTFHLMDRYAGTGRLQRFVYAGSSEAYAGTVQQFGWPVPTAEDVPLCITDPTNVRWSYGASKLHGEVLVTSAGRQLAIDYTIIRYHNVYGPRMGDKHVIPDFLSRMRKGVYSLYGYKDTRSFLYVDDAVKATIALAEAPAAANEIVNVGSEEEVPIREVAKRILAIARVDADIELYESPPGSVSRRAPDTAKLRRLTGFRPEWSLVDGLKATMDFYLDSSPG